jgi:spermidine synthase
VFQIAWMRELRLVFGATTAATAAVLAVFMAGLGVGSAILGKRADRAANPLYMYGALEIAIALSAAISPWLIAAASSFYFGLGGQESLGFGGATAVRLLLTVFIMGVPAFLMGGTLPAAVRAVTSSADVHRRGLAVLYGANTLGAVAGTSVATLFALESLGTRATLLAGCALGLLAGALAVGVSRRLPPVADPKSSPHLKSTDLNGAHDFAAGETVHRPWLIYLAAAVLGFAFFALELVWYRMLAPILGGTAFTFGLILCAALVGIGVGGLAYNVIFRRLAPTWLALAITCGLEALFTIVPFALGDELALLAARQTEGARGFAALVAGWSVVIGIVVLPVALISGLQFPLLTGLLGRGRGNVSEQLGKAYAWNTFGAIAGSLVAGFGAFPLVGAIGLWLSIAGLLAALSILLIVGGPWPGRHGAAAVAAMAVATVASMFATGPTAAWRHGSIGAGRANITHMTPNEVQLWLNATRHHLDWETDGVESSIGITSEDGLAFIVNGKSDGNSLGDVATQVGSVTIGAVLHPNPKHAMVIGLGTGESAGWLAEMRDMERVDAVELEPAIDEMAARCSELNQNVLNNPRVRRIYADGREFVFTTDNKYDIIFSEPSNPYRAGVAALYTLEFYEAVRQRLNPDGIFLQWMQGYEIDDSSFFTVLATVRSIFPHVELWETMGADLQIVCSQKPLKHSAEDLRERIKSPAIQEAFARCWHTNDVEGFLGRFVASNGYVDTIVSTPLVDRNSDDRTVLEYSFARTVGHRTPFSIEATRQRLKDTGFERPAVSGAIDWNDIELRRQASNLVLGGLMSYALLTKPEDVKLVTALAEYPKGDFGKMLELWPATKRDPTDAILRLILARGYAELAKPECLTLLKPVEERFPVDAAAIRGIYYFRAKDPAKATDEFERFFKMLATNPWLIQQVSYTAFDRATEISKADPNPARRLFPLLSRPFASHRLNDRRQRARVFIAESLGPSAVAEAMAEYEPHVLWTAEFLKLRAESYAALKHPLAAQAANDLKRYESRRTAKEKEKGTEPSKSPPAATGDESAK